MDKLFEKEEGQKTPLHLFVKNTKQTCIIMCISLFIIIVISVLNSNSNNSNINNGSNIYSKLFILTAAILLSYCFYTNMKETSILYHSMEHDTDIRKNIIMSYTFSCVLLLFVIYLLYTIIF